METLRELIDSCTWEYMKTYSRLRILGGSLDILGGELEAFKSDSVAVIVKSVKEISFDEIPIFNAIVSALSTYNITPRFYEYDMIAEGRGRYEELSRVLEDSIGRRMGVIAVLPYLAPIAVLSRVSEPVVEALDSALRVQVSVRYENLLYIPERRGDEVEVIGKENSASSYDRAEWFRVEAERRGFKRVIVKFLSDNKSIFNYVTSMGPKGIYRRVPVTKLASYIVALARCYSLGGVEEVMREEEATHMLYILGVQDSVRASIVDGLERELRSAKLAIPRESLYTWIEKGSRRVVGELVRRFGLE
ncbi:MAG: hypothetical protein ACO2O2_07530 [Acidilobaceae archaeon]|jgi:hypothetical protein